MAEVFRLRKDEAGIRGDVALEESGKLRAHHDDVIADLDVANPFTARDDATGGLHPETQWLGLRSRIHREAPQYIEEIQPRKGNADLYFAGARRLSRAML